MPLFPTPHPADPFGIARPILFLTLLVGLLGTAVELLLLEHVEDVWQLIPIALIVVSLIVLFWHTRRATGTTLRAFRITMALFVLSGLLGVWLHYRGNVEFELEMYPSMSGLALFREAMMGATPSLAPGTMIQLGLLGFVYALRYPLSPPS
jgi:tellurite resistance protein TehA-like permease